MIIIVTYADSQSVSRRFLDAVCLRCVYDGRYLLLECRDTKILAWVAVSFELNEHFVHESECLCIQHNIIYRQMLLPVRWWSILCKFYKCYLISSGNYFVSNWMKRIDRNDKSKGTLSWFMIIVIFVDFNYIVEN